MVNSQIRYLPIYTVFWLLGTFIISYSVAVWEGHVYPILPYISETGTLSPESCLFGQMLNIGALLVGVTVYFRYRQVNLFIRSNNLSRRYQWLNRACLFCGTKMALGISIVANFQCLNMLIIHLLGAMLAFKVGTAYMILQTILSAMLRSKESIVLKITIFRTLLLILVIISSVTTTVFAIRSLKGLEGGIREAMMLNPQSDRYVDRLISTFSEWTVALSIGLYFLTFTYDFKYLNFKLEFTDVRCERKVMHREN